MKKVACVIIFWLTASLLIGGCSRDAKEDAGEEENSSGIEFG